MAAKMLESVRLLPDSQGSHSYESVNSKMETSGTEMNQPVAESKLARSCSTEEHKNDSEHEKNKWEEATLFVREGEAHDEFFNHPTGEWSKWAYEILHHPVFYVFDFLLCIMLMLLALIESPSVLFGIPDDDESVVKIHGTLECAILFLFGVILVLRLLWQTPRNFFTHFRSVFLTIILVVMIIESLTVLIRQQSHIRVTRALRPVFFLDTHLMSDVRRVLRHILHSLKNILDIIVHLLFIIALFSIIAYYLYAETAPDYFQTFELSYVSLFITFTTANNPDVMMETYPQTNTSPLFFISYLIITLYFITNILLAVVYSEFSKQKKEKFKKMFLHKREALYKAFNLLADKNRIKVQDFLLFMQHYKPRMPEWQVMCIFRALKEGGGQVQDTACEEGQDTACEERQDTACEERRYAVCEVGQDTACEERQDTACEEGQDAAAHLDCTQTLSLKEFYTFFEVQNLWWTMIIRIKKKNFIQRIRHKIYQVVRWRWFNSIIYMVILLNTIFLILCVICIPILKVPEQVSIVIPLASVFLSVYILENILKIMALGWGYFTKFWNMFDFVLLYLSLIALCLEWKYHILIILRPIKLIRFVHLNKRYRDISNTIVILIPQLISVGILLLVIYYFFAIIGMEFLEGKVHQGCCSTASYDVGKYFAAGHSETSVNDFYFMNFDNIYRSYVTLFTLMVINNWFIIMEGFASEVENGWLARIFFMTYFIVTLVVLQVAITFTVEAFVLQLEQDSNSHSTEEESNKPKAKSTSELERDDPDSVEEESNKPKGTCTFKLERDDPDSIEDDKRKKEVLIILLPEDIQKVEEEIAGFNERTKNTSFNLNYSIRRLMRMTLEDSNEFRGQRLRTNDDAYLWQFRSDIETWTEEQDKQFQQNQANEGKPNPEKTPLKIMAWNLTKKVTKKVLNNLLESILGQRM